MKCRQNTIGARMNPTRIVLMALLAWSSPGVLSAQLFLPDTVQAILLHYKILPPVNRLDAEKPSTLKDYYLILQPPMVILRPDLDMEKESYKLHHLQKQLGFYCQEQEEGITFIPFNYHLEKKDITHLPWKKDTVHNYPVFEIYLYSGGDTLHFWNTEAFGISYSPFSNMQGVPLHYEHIIEKEKWRIVLHKVDTIQMPSRYFDPALSNAPIHFDSPITAFVAIGYRFWEQSDKRGYHLPKIKGKLIGRNEKVRLKTLKGKIIPLLLVDYELLGTLPDYLKNWMNEYLNQPGIYPLILSRNHIDIITKSIGRDPILASIPHLQINAMNFLRIGGYAPLHIVILDQGGIIRYNENAHYLFSSQILDKYVGLLQDKWKGTSGQQH